MVSCDVSSNDAAVAFRLVSATCLTMLWPGLLHFELEEQSAVQSKHMADLPAVAERASEYEKLSLARC